MAKIPTMDEMAKQLAEEALDNFLYDGKNLREWMKIIASEDAISRQAVLEWIKGSLEQYANTYSNDMLNMWMLFEEQIKAMPPVTQTSSKMEQVEQEPCEDWHEIPSDEMTLGQARQAVKYLRKFVMDNHILPKLQSCEDCISKANALRVAKNEYLRGWHDALCKALSEKYSIHCEEGNFSVIQEETITGLGLLMDCAVGKDVESYMSALPSVTPTHKKGHWISIYGNVKCSVCGNIKDGRSVGKATHYCDFCGARMEVLE